MLSSRIFIAFVLLVYRVIVDSHSIDLFKILIPLFEVNYVIDVCNPIIGSLTNSSLPFTRNSTQLYTYSIEVLTLKNFFDQHNGSNWRWRNISYAGNVWNFTDFDVFTYQGNIGISLNETLYDNSNKNNTLVFYSDPCLDQWQGISCTNGSNYLHIVGLELSKYDIHGTVLDHFFQNLTRLETLDLSQNQLSGQLFNLSTMSNLTKLNLTFNFHIEGQLNISLFPTSLIDLELGSLNLYTTLPHNIDRLVNLRILNFFNHTLYGTLPENFYELRELCFINLQYNNLYGPVSNGFNNLTKLRLLNIGHNFLTGTIPELTNLTQSLRVILLYQNMLHGPIPSFLSNCTRLIDLNLAVNQLTGTIPQSLLELEHLLLLTLGYNQMEGTIPYPNSVSYQYNAMKLDVYELDDNYLTGHLPEFDQMRMMYYFAASDNFLEGTIPLSIQYLKLLFYLIISNSGIEGTLPNELSACTNLYYLYMSDNRLNGSLPSHLTRNMQYLTRLVLYSNRLTGYVPDFQDNKRLQILLLSNNSLYGTIPIFEGLDWLLQVHLQGNFLTGTVPMITSSQLRDIDFSDNQLHGSLPIVFGNSGSSNNESLMVNIKLSGNRLTGSLPVSLNRLASLEMLLLQGNELTGPIDGLFNVTWQPHLSNIDLGQNQLSGTIPSGLFQLSNLTLLSLGQNCFSGELPDSLCNATRLQQLILDGLASAEACVVKYPTLGIFHSVSTNSMSGFLPDCVWKLPNLQVLHVSGNGLMGSIPSSEFNSKLMDVVVSHNRLSGSLPAWFQSQTWTNLDISYNKLVGQIEGMVDFSPYNSTTTESSSAAQQSMILKLNRFTGRFPPQLVAAPNIDVLEGNVFECGQELPAQDPNKNTYICGSSQLDNSLISFVTVVFGSIVALGLMALLWVYWQMVWCGKKDDPIYLTQAISRHYVYWKEVVWYSYKFLWIVDHVVDLIQEEQSEMMEKEKEREQEKDNVDDDVEKRESLDSEDNEYTRVQGKYRDSLLQTLMRSSFMGALKPMIWEPRGNLVLEDCIRPSDTMPSPSDPYASQDSTSAGRQDTPHLDISIWLLEKLGLGCHFIRWFQDALKLDELELKAWRHLVQTSRLSHTMAFLRSLRLIQRVSLSITLWAMGVCLPFYLIMYHLPGQPYESYQDQYTWATTSVFLSGVVPGSVLLCLCVVISLRSMSFINSQWQRLFRNIIRMSRKNSIELVHSSTRSQRPQSATQFSSCLLPPSSLASMYHQVEINNPILGNRGETAEGRINLFPSALSTRMNELKPNEPNVESSASSVSSASSASSASASTSPEGSFTISFRLSIQSLCSLSSIWVVGVVMANLSLVMAMNVGYVYVVTTAQLSSAQYFFFQTLMGLAKFVWNMGVLPLLMARLPRGYKRKASLHLSLLVFNNLVAPIVALSFVDPQCFSSFFFGTDTIHTSYQVPFCSFIFISFSDSGFLTLKCDAWNTDSFTSSFQPTFLYYNVCGSNLLRYYVPVYTYKYLMVLVLYPLLLIYIGYAQSAWFYDPLLQFFSSLLRPQSRNEALRLNPQLVQVNILNHLVMLLTFGLNAPLFTLVCCLVVYLTSVFWQLAVIRYLKYDSRDAPFTIHRGTGEAGYKKNDIGKIDNGNPIDRCPSSGHVCALCRSTLSREELHQESRRGQALEEALFEEASSLQSSFLVIVGSAVMFNGLICADIIGDKAGVWASIYTIIAVIGLLVFMLLLLIKLTHLL